MLLFTLSLSLFQSQTLFLFEKIAFLFADILFLNILPLPSRLSFKHGSLQIEFECLQITWVSLSFEL